MKILLLLISAFIVSLSAMAQEVPYRNDADFKVFSSFQWITDKPEDSPDYSVSPSKKFDPDPKMHLFLTINLNNIQDNEFRVRVYDSGNELTYGKKLKEGMELKLNFGDFE